MGLVKGFSREMNVSQDDVFQTFKGKYPGQRYRKINPRALFYQPPNV
jgi:hypothetical protein